MSTSKKKSAPSRRERSKAKRSRNKPAVAETAVPANGCVSHGVPVKSDPPVNVAIPSTTEDRMKAIVSLATAVECLSKALLKSDTQVHIVGNTITGVQPGGAGIKVESDVPMTSFGNSVLRGY